jgi:hydrogenase small subunit
MNCPTRFEPARDKGLGETGLTRRGFIKLGAALASLLALPAGAGAQIASALEKHRRQPVIWLSFQECTGCTESLTRSEAPSLERLLFELLSLDYQHTLQAASGEAAEAARLAGMRADAGRYLLVLDGSVPLAADGACCTIAGMSSLAMLRDCVESAAAVMALGSCAAFGGLPAAAPNPSGARGIGDLARDGLIAPRPLVNLPGCPPIPEVIAATLAHYIVFGAFPELDEAARPRVFYGRTVHEGCYRYPHFAAGRFAMSFDDEGARKGWCLYHLGCRGPVTHNACATLKWNGGVGFPVEAGHPCLGCSEPGFWDRGDFYRDLEQLAAARATPLPDAAAEGRSLYEENCVYCHPPDPARLRADAEALSSLMRSGPVGAHRRFNFTERELEALTEYLRTAKAAAKGAK